MVILVQYEVSEKDAQDQGIGENTTSEEELLLTRSSLFCVSIINYLVFLVWLEVSHYSYFVIIGVVVQHLLIADVIEHIL